MSVTIMF